MGILEEMSQINQSYKVVSEDYIRQLFREAGVILLMNDIPSSFQSLKEMGYELVTDKINTPGLETGQYLYLRELDTSKAYKGFKICVDFQAFDIKSREMTEEELSGRVLQ